jgi:CAP12/Pycsar effector protein, TIR domain
MVRPSLFVGSSSEGLRIAEAIQVVLDPVCEVELWTQGTFGLTQGTLESLVLAVSRFDFALLVLTADDMTVSRGAERTAARDNVLFELGLFIGSLGRDRTFMLYDRTNRPALPSDLAGITAASFAPHSSGNLEAALGAPCAQIRNMVERLGPRKDKGFQDLEKATLSVEVAGETMQSLLHLLARSRKVELDIIATQFGPLIDPQRLRQMRRDLADLEEILSKEQNADLPETRNGRNSPKKWSQASKGLMPG